MLDESKWAKPIPVTQADLAFPANGWKLVPAFEDLPDEFQHLGTPRTPLARKCFNYAQALFMHYSGGLEIREEDLVFVLNEDQDNEMFERHLTVALGTYGNKHEHKIAGFAWLVSRWMHLKEGG